MASSLLCGISTQSLLFSFILLFYTTSFAITYYGVLPQRVIHFTCLELQQITNTTLQCDSSQVSVLSTKRIAYLSSAYSFTSFITNGPLTRLADQTSKRKYLLIWIILGLTFDQISQIFCTTYYQMILFHTIAGCFGNLYVTLALLFSFIADVAAGHEATTEEEVQVQRRRDYGLAEGMVYVGIMLGPALGGYIFRISHQSYTTPYWVSSCLSLLLLLAVLMFQPSDEVRGGVKGGVKVRVRVRGRRGEGRIGETGTTTTTMMSESLLMDVVAEEQEGEEEQEARPSCCSSSNSIPTQWWNPLGPFVLLFCHDKRIVWSTVLLLAWLGQKGVDFLYNPFIRYQFNRGAFLIGMIATVKASASVFSNVVCVRLFTTLRWSGLLVLLIGCMSLIVAYSLIGFSSSSSSGGGGGGGGGGGSTDPDAFFWCGVAISGLAAFLSPM